MRSADSISVKPSWRLGGLLVIVMIMAVLTAGLPLVNASIFDRQRLAAGGTLAIGPSRKNSARITVGQGWSLRKSQSDPRQDYELYYGGVDLSVRYVTLIGRSQPGKLWSGLGQIVRISSSSARLGAPSLIENSQGLRGITGTFTRSGRAGLAAVFPGPSGTFAIEMTTLARPGARAADRAAAQLVVRSIIFPEVQR